MSLIDVEVAGVSLPRRRSSGLKTGSSQTNLLASNTETLNLTTLPPAGILSDHGTATQSPESSWTNRFVWALTLISGAAMLYVVGTKTNEAISARGLRFSSEDVGQYHRLLSQAGVNRYELIPDVKSSHGRTLENAGQDNLDLQVSVLDTTFDLVLNRADDMLDPDYKEITIEEDGSVVKEPLQKGCVYSASIRGDPQSFGSVSLCDGYIDAILFHKTDSHKEFVITPVSDDMHVAFRQLSARRSLRPCPETHPIVEGPERALAGTWKPVGKQNKTVDIIIVNDAVRSKTAKDRRKARASALAIIKAVNSFYAQMAGPDMYGIQFRIVSQIALRKEPWNLKLDENGHPDSQDLLEEFYKWKKTAKLPTADLVHLLSGREHKDGYVGRSAQAGITDGGVCTDRNVGVSQVTGFNMGLYAKIVAHELGHSLAATHDNEYKDCKSYSNTFMWAGISLEKGTKFSSCTANSIKSFLDGQMQFPYKGCLE